MSNAKLSETGSFKAAALYLLAFDPIQRTLNVVTTVDAFGPHQYLCSNRERTRIYATTWATPPILSSFAVGPSAEDNTVPAIRHLNNVDIREYADMCHRNYLSHFFIQPRLLPTSRWSMTPYTLRVGTSPRRTRSKRTAR